MKRFSWTKAESLDWILILAGLFLLFFDLDHSISGDAAERYKALEYLVDQGAVFPTGYSHVQVFLAAPLYLLGRLWLGPLWWVHRFNTLVFFLFLALMWLGLRGRTSPRVGRTFILLLICGSMFPFHLRHFYGEMLSACLFGAGALWLGRRGFSGGAALVLGTVNIPATFGGLALGLGRESLARRRLRYLLPVLLAAGLILAEWWLKQGAAPWSASLGSKGLKTLMPYSGLPGFSYPLFFGVLSILFSFGKGLLFFAPGLLLLSAPLSRSAPARLRSLTGLYLFYAAGLVLVYAKWWSWYGGVFWGPRFFIFCSIPACLALASVLSREDRNPLLGLLLLLVLAQSLWLGLNGVVFGHTGLDQCFENNFALEHLCWYVPEFSVLWRPLVIGLKLDPAKWPWIVYGGLVFLRLAWPWLGSIAGWAVLVFPGTKDEADRKTWKW